MAEATTGGCLCGDLRYEITGPVSIVANCHCTMCRRASGAPFVTWAVVRRDAFRFTAGAPARFASSETCSRLFCPRCGTPLVFEDVSRPDHVDITTGSLDDPDDLPPERHIWTSAQLHWLRLGDALPRFEESSM